MTEAINLYVRRANAQSPIELVINKAGISEIVIVNIGQAKNLLRDLLPMLLTFTTPAISPGTNDFYGKSLDGILATPSAPTTANTRYWESGKVKASR